MQKALGKPVALELETRRKADGEPAGDTLRAQGFYYQKEGAAHLVFKEGPTQNTHIRIGAGLVHVHRFGSLSGDLWFCEGSRRDTRYETPYGRLLLTVDTRQIHWDPQDLRLYIRYNLLDETRLLSENELTIRIRERKNDEEPG